MRKQRVFTIIKLLVLAAAISLLGRFVNNQTLVLPVPASLPDGTGTQPDACEVQSVKDVTNGIQPDWSADGELVAFSRLVEDSYEVFLMNPDGSDQRCLTCNQNLPEVLDGKHKGKPTLHPDGNYLLFSAENENGGHSGVTVPGIGTDHDFWVTDLEGTQYWRLTEYPKDYTIQYPRFNRDGTKLLWSIRYQKGTIWRRGKDLGLWHLRMANFQFENGALQLTNQTDIDPYGPGFYEPHGFSPANEDLIIFTGREEEGVPRSISEIFTYNLKTEKLTNITRREEIHDEQAIFSPDGQKISLMTGPFRGLIRAPLIYKTELYLMDADGSNLKRLTHFNDPDSSQYLGRNAQLAKNSWSPDGSQIISAYHAGEDESGKIFVVTFQGRCGNQ